MVIRFLGTYLIHMRNDDEMLFVRLSDIDYPVFVYGLINAVVHQQHHQHVEINCLWLTMANFRERVEESRPRIFFGMSTNNFWLMKIDPREQTTEMFETEENSFEKIRA